MLIRMTDAGLSCGVQCDTYGAGFLVMTRFGKEQKGFAHSRCRRRDRTSIHRTAIAVPMKHFRGDFVDAVVHELHGRAPKWTVHVVTPPTSKRWTGWTEQLAQDLKGGLVRQTALHDRCRRPRERQPPAPPRSSRCDHLHRHRATSARVVYRVL